MLDALARHYAGLPQPWWALPLAYETLLLGQWVAERLLIRRHRDASAGVRDRRALRFWLWCWLLLQVPVGRAGRWWTPFDGLSAPLVGLVLALAGGALRLWAIEHLGRQFSYRTRPVEEQRLVTTGPYRFVRHPLYTGLLLFFAGLPLIVREFLSACVIVALVPTIVAIRIRREERVLRERYGAEFLAWRGRTKRLVPGLL